MLSLQRIQQLGQLLPFRRVFMPNVEITTRLLTDVQNQSNAAHDLLHQLGKTLSR